MKREIFLPESMSRRDFLTASLLVTEILATDSATDSLFQEPPEPSGVVVETVSEVSTLKKAGIQARDVIQTWKRLATPPANPRAARGTFYSYFDWIELVTEQAPRGRVELTGIRKGHHWTLVVEPGLWDAEVRPSLPAISFERYTKGKAELEAGHIEEARLTWWPLVNEVESHQKRDLGSWILLQLGKQWQQQGNWKSAKRCYRKVLDGNSGGRAKIEASLSLGEGCRRHGELQEASSACRDGLREVSYESLAASRLLDLQGEIARFQRDLARTQTCFRKSLRIRERLSPDSLEVARSLNFLALLRRLLGDLESAESFSNRALAIQENLAVESLGVATSLRSLGAISLQRGEIARAQRQFTQALQIQQRLAPKSLEIAILFGFLGHVCIARGAFQTAQTLFLKTRSTIRRLSPNSGYERVALLSQGFIALKLNELDRAQVLFEDAQRIEAPKNYRNLSHADYLRNLGMIALQGAEPDKSYDLFKQSLEICNHLTPKSRRTALNLLDLGRTELARKRLVSAEHYLSKAVRLFSYLNIRDHGTAICLNALGQVAHAHRDWKQASYYFSASLESIETQLLHLGGSYQGQVEFLSLSSEIYTNFLGFLLDKQDSAEAFLVLERSKARILLRILSEREVTSSSPVPTDLEGERHHLAHQIDKAHQNLSYLDPSLNQDEIEKVHQHLAELRWEAQEVEVKIRHATSRLSRFQYSEPLTASEVQSHLDPGTALISFCVGKKRAHAFLLQCDERLQVHEAPLSAEALRKKVRAFRSALERDRAPGGFSGEKSGHLGRELYRDLILPMEPWLASAKRLLLVPDGSLHLLPFAALIREVPGSEGGGNKEQYLIEWKPLHYVASATVYAKLREESPWPSASTDDGAELDIAVFGDPDFGMDSRTGIDSLDDTPPDPTAERNQLEWKPLPFSREEVLEIAKLFPKRTRMFLGEAATEEQVKAQGKGSRILHIASHAYFDDKMPQNSAVVLSRPAELQEGQDNGLLQAWEIIDQVCIDADLVVLSGCNTATGELKEGEGLISLSRAFQAAGARTVIASQWAADDKATSELMVSFYRHLKAGQTKDEALRSAQIELIQAKREIKKERGEPFFMSTYTPYHWALFQVIGDYQ